MRAKEGEFALRIEFVKTRCHPVAKSNIWRVENQGFFDCVLMDVSPLVAEGDTFANY